MTIWGVLMTLQRRVATPLVTKSSTGPALSRHSAGKILVENPMISWVKAKAKAKATDVVERKRSEDRSSYRVFPRASRNHALFYVQRDLDPKNPKPYHTSTLLLSL